MLSALAAEGKNFDRDELNAMLDKLAATPEPKVKHAHLQRMESLAWVINGKRILADRSDVELLEKFMKGDVYLRDGSDGDSVSMKSQLPRLRELLGEPKN